MFLSCFCYEVSVTVSTSLLLWGFPSTRGVGPHDFPRLLSAPQLEAFLCLRLDKQCIPNDFLQLNYKFTHSNMLFSTLVAVL